MKRFILLLLLTAFTGVFTYAQDEKVKPLEGDPGYSPGFKQEMSYLSDKFDERMQVWLKNANRPSSDELRSMNAYGFAPDEVPTYSMEVVQDRLNKLNFVVPMDYNPIVKSYIDLYTVRYRKMTELLLGRAEIYFPIFEEVFDKEGVPQELKYVAIIESALNAQAKSWAGAKGFFQFMYGTARLYDLKMNSFVDERCDPYKSATAAARYMRDLYKIYGDWHLVMASYNCGPGNMNRAIRRSGGKKTYWEVAPYLPAETRGYVPGFIGAAYAMEYATEHNLYPRYTDFSFNVDEIKVVRQKLSLRDLAIKTNSDYETLKKLNPELKLGVVPYSNAPYAVRVPHKTALAVRKAMREGSIELNELQPTYTKASNTNTIDRKLVYHVLAKGEQLDDVAKEY
ncbi:MAG: transglycosylase SLT domain-containing protein, partial [Bacteroidota bacterium]